MRHLNTDLPILDYETLDMILKMLQIAITELNFIPPDERKDW